MSSIGSIDQPWLLHYPCGVPHHLEYPPEPAYWLLEQAAARAPYRTACRYYQQKLNYAELLDKSRRMSTVLRQRGLKPGERVALLLPNVPEYLIALFGVWMAGGVVVPLNPVMVAEEIADLVRETNCRFAVALDVLLPQLHFPFTRSNGHASNGHGSNGHGTNGHSIAGSNGSRSSTNGSNGNGMHRGSPLEMVLVSTLTNRLPYWERMGYSSIRLKRLGFRSLFRDGTAISFDEALDAAEPDMAPYRAAPETPAYILPTGGTTGHPKAVVLTHRNMLANAWQLLHWSGNQFGHHSILAVLPFFHSYGLSAGALHGVAMGATLVLHHRFKALSALQLIERHRPTIFLAVPAMIVAINKEMREKPYDLSSLQFCISGGAPLDPHIAAEYAKHSGSIVVEGFGLSEASPVTHVGPLDGNARVGTIGFPLPDTEARIVDAETGTIELPHGEVGELIIRGPQVMAGYWNNPAATAVAIRDGWLHTGDLGSCDDDGFFRIVDRKKDMIITSGNNVYPTDVEQVLRCFPGLSDIAIVGVPDDVRGEVVKAVVCVEKGHHFDPVKFDEFAREHLSAYKRPRLVEVIEGDLPRNPLGKLLRRLLREPQVNGRAPAASPSVAR